MEAKVIAVVGKGTYLWMLPIITNTNYWNLRSFDDLDQLLKSQGDDHEYVALNTAETIIIFVINLPLCQTIHKIDLTLSLPPYS